MFEKWRVNVRDLGLRFLLPTRQALSYGSKTFFRIKNQIAKSYFEAPLKTFFKKIQERTWAFYFLLHIFDPNGWGLWCFEISEHRCKLLVAESKNRSVFMVLPLDENFFSVNIC